ncbi:hypothetical protein KCU85_g467, partial [Aureobasidium melanogenum]
MSISDMVQHGDINTRYQKVQHERVGNFKLPPRRRDDARPRRVLQINLAEDVLASELSAFRGLAASAAPDF